MVCIQCLAFSRIQHEHFGSAETVVNTCESSQRTRACPVSRMPRGSTVEVQVGSTFTIPGRDPIVMHPISDAGAVANQRRELEQ
jgi:hypothetical protein